MRWQDEGRVASMPRNWPVNFILDKIYSNWAKYWKGAAAQCCKIGRGGDNYTPNTNICIYEKKGEGKGPKDLTQVSDKKGVQKKE